MKLAFVLPVSFAVISVCTACSSTPAAPSDGCGVARTQVKEYSGHPAVFAFLQSPDVHDGSGRGLVRFGAGSELTCSLAPAAANHGKITMVVSSNAPDSLQVFMAGTFVNVNGNGAANGTVTRVAQGDSVIYTATVTSTVPTSQILLSGQLQFVPVAATFEDDLANDANWIRRFTFEFSFERP